MFCWCPLQPAVPLICFSPPVLDVLSRLHAMVFLVILVMFLPCVWICTVGTVLVTWFLLKSWKKWLSIWLREKGFCEKCKKKKKSFTFCFVPVTFLEMCGVWISILQQVYWVTPRELLLSWLEKIVFMWLHLTFLVYFCAVQLLWVELFKVCMKSSVILLISFCTS